MDEYNDSSWAALADKYNFVKKNYGNGQIYDFPLIGQMDGLQK